jgi:hypothetical protein
LPLSLEELKIIYCALEDDQVFNSMVSYLGTKTSITKINPCDFTLYLTSSSPLKKLDLSGNKNLSNEQWVRLLYILHNVKLEELNMQRIENEIEIHCHLVGAGSYSSRSDQIPEMQQEN